MKNVGIICEYNPIHLGHLYHISETLKKIGDAGVVCIMSGSFVQRGEPAIFDKYSRAGAAIRREGEAGADLVLELPLTKAISSAGDFATGGVELLGKLGCIDYLSFGSESGELSLLRQGADILLDESLSDKLKPFLDSGISFAAARQKAVEEISPATAGILTSPNNILAVEYLKALTILNSRIQPITVKRLGAVHDSRAESELPSATKIRQLLHSGGDWQSLVPDRAAEIYNRELCSGHAPYSIKNAERAVLYRLRTMSNSDFDALPFGGEGLNIRLQACAREGATVEEIIENAKTKRYAHSRLRRMVLCAFLQITAADMQREIPYARVLAFNDRGREILNQCRFPILTNAGQIRKMGEASREYFNMESRCADLLTLCLPENTLPQTGSEWRKRGEYILRNDNRDGIIVMN